MKKLRTTILAPLIVIVLAVVLLLLGQKADTPSAVVEETAAVSAQETDIPSDLPIDGPVDESYSTEGENAQVHVISYHSQSSLPAIASVYTTYFVEREYALVESQEHEELITLLGVHNGTQMSVVGYPNGSNILVEVSVTRRGR